MNNKILDFLKNPIPTIFSTETKTELILSGIYHILEYVLVEEEAVDLIEKALLSSLAPEIKQNLFLILIRRNNFQNSLIANDAIFTIYFRTNDPVFKDLIIQNAVKANKATYLAVFELYKREINNLESIDSDFSKITGFLMNTDNDHSKRFLIEKARNSDLHIWADIAEFFLSPGEAKRSDLINQFPKFSDREKLSLFSVLERLVYQENRDAVDFVFKLFFEFSPGEVLDLIRNYELKPPGILDHALFLFLTRQWTEYDRIDFNSEYLKMAYQNASARLKNRILHQSRKFGRTHWLQSSEEIKQIRWISDLTEQDWTTVVEQLIKTNRYSDLIKLLNYTPAFWAAYIISHIKLQKTLEDLPFNKEQSWQTLLDLINPHDFGNPQPEIITKSNIPFEGITASSITQDGQDLFVAGSGNEICRLAIKEMKLNLPCIMAPASQVRFLHTSRDQNYLIGAFSDHVIRVFRLSDNKIVKTFEGHNGIIKKLLLDKDERILFSTGFDGKLYSWRFPLGPNQNQQQVSTHECFDMDLSQDGNLLLTADSSGSITAYDPVKLTKIYTLETGIKPVMLLCFANHDNRIISYTKDNRIRFYNAESQKHLFDINDFMHPLSALRFSPSDRFVLSVDVNGICSVFSSASGKLLAKNKISKSPLINIHNQPSDDMLAVSRSGELIQIDLSVMEAVFTPIRNLQYQEMESLKNRMKKYSGINQNWLAFLSGYFNFIHRYDINLTGEHRIEFSEFDIEIA